MAEQNTIGGLIERVKAEGQLTRNTGTNSIKVTNELLVTVSNRLNITNDYIANLNTSIKKYLGLTKDMLNDIANNDLLSPAPKPEPKKPAVTAPPTIMQDTQNTVAIFGGLGLIGKAIALAVGGIAGVLLGQWNAIKGVAKLLTPASWQESLAGLKTALGERLGALKTALTDRIASVRTAVTNSITAIGDFLKIDPESNLGKTIAKFKSFFAPITNMLDEAGQVLKGIVGSGEGKGPLTRIRNWFNIIKGYLGSLGASVGGIGRIVGKIFAPIAIIMTAFDTVKGAIDGYATGGILGGLQGAIDGLFTSLITVPLDLLKDGVAWVLSKMGFDSGAEALNSFSFTDLFKQLTDKIFAGVKTAIDFIKDLFSFGEGDKTALGVLGKLVDIIYLPLNLAINFVKGLFGWSEPGDEPFKLSTFVADMFNAGITWAKDKLSGVGAAIKTKFTELADWLVGIPDRVTFEAKEMMIDLKAKLKAGFIMFGEWFAGIPARIKLLALETLSAVAVTNPITGTRYSLIDDGQIANARNEVSAVGQGTPAKLQAVEDERIASLAELQRQATAQQNNATVVNSGGNSTSQTTNHYYSSSSTVSSLDPADPRF